MTIDNIVSGFRGTGIYPFEPNAILDNLIPRDVEPKDSSSPEFDSRKDKENTCQQFQQSSETSFTPETIKLYEKRLENGYNVYDANYLCFVCCI